MVGDKRHVLPDERRGDPGGQVNRFPFGVVSPKDTLAGDELARHAVVMGDEKSLRYIVRWSGVTRDTGQALVVNGQHNTAAKSNLVATIATDDVMEVGIGID